MLMPIPLMAVCGNIVRGIIRLTYLVFLSLTFPEAHRYSVDKRSTTDADTNPQRLCPMVDMCSISRISSHLLSHLLCVQRIFAYRQLHPGVQIPESGRGVFGNKSDWVHCLWDIDCWVVGDSS